MRTTLARAGRLGPVVAAGLTFGLAQAQSPGDPTQTIVVTGVLDPVNKSDLSNDPAAGPASITVLRLPDEKKRGVRDYVELLKPVMGVAANNFDQGGIGFGFTMRGFSERSNGGGVAYAIDGVPVNLPSHALTNGYGDLTPLVPELLDTMVLTRGPFDVRFGANSLGGSMAFTTQDMPARGAAAAAGNFDFGRLFVAVPGDMGPANGYLSLVGSHTSGYRDNSRLEVVNLFSKVSFPMPGGSGSLRFQLFTDTFGAPGFIRRDLVENGTLDPRTAINPTDGGRTDLNVVAFRYRGSGEQPLTATVYLMRSELERYSNRQSTIPISPLLAGQALQIDDRHTYGLSAEKYLRWGSERGTGVDLLFGGGVRVDDTTSQIYNTVQRVRGTRTEDTDFKLTNPFVYAQVNAKPAPWVKLTAGVRFDRLQFEIDDRQRSLAVEPRMGVVQPKAGIVISPWRGLDLFANYGKSFLPPSATGGQLSRNPALRAPELATREIGVQWTSPGAQWQLLADVYRTTFTNEILNQPPPALPTYLGPSRRDGFDLEARWRAWRQGARTLALFANYSKLDGELVNRASGTSIPDVADYFFKYGVDWTFPLGRDARVVRVAASQVWEGPKPLNTTNTLRTRKFSRIDFKATYTDRDWKGFNAFLTAIVYPDRRLEETAFTFGTPATVGVSPKAPLTVQAGAYFQF